MGEAELSVVKGTLDVLVLKALGEGPLHGFQITRWLEDRSGGELAVEDSAVYQALYRMEERGLVEPEWGVTENNRRARYYGLTKRGRAHLRDETRRMLRYTEVLAVVLGGIARR